MQIGKNIIIIPCHYIPPSTRQLGKAKCITLTLEKEKDVGNYLITRQYKIIP